MSSSTPGRCSWLPAWISIHAAHHVQRGVLGILSSRPFFSPVLSPAAQDGCFTKMENTASLSLARPPSLPSLTLPESKRGFPTHFICTDEDPLNVSCSSDAESGMVTCTWCWIKKRIEKLFLQKGATNSHCCPDNSLIFVLYIHPINITYPIIIQKNLQVQ